MTGSNCQLRHLAFQPKPLKLCCQGPGLSFQETIHTEKGWTGCPIFAFHKLLVVPRHGIFLCPAGTPTANLDMLWKPVARQSTPTYVLSHRESFHWILLQIILHKEMEESHGIQSWSALPREMGQLQALSPSPSLSLSLPRVLSFSLQVCQFFSSVDQFCFKEMPAEKILCALTPWSLIRSNPRWSYRFCPQYDLTVYYGSLWSLWEHPIGSHLIPSVIQSDFCMTVGLQVQAWLFSPTTPTGTLGGYVQRKEMNCVENIHNMPDNG